MSIALQIRDVPEDVRDVLAQQAAQRGQSLQAYLLAVIQHEARLLRNKQAFSMTADLRVDIPAHLSPEIVIREGHEGDLDIDQEPGHQ
ncbi:FitA-like ribbon-helix-helix domain-containing protein [Nocardia macrotermitis]|uniref:Antitoxin FitA-like ribbon-helix-helix domain-containing protein n=1 Tax=Nocardia macrotermitis TaxID=2585198 RepID=A0A7K0DCR1_9NOCA|nr:hypothetical protein [Nocardia macrotermitis]MQY23409.1 hypothetical protein [Nocardia macrotermitis]